MFFRLGIPLGYWAFALWASALQADTATFDSATAITGTSPHAGGFSALEVTEADHALTVSDRGHFFDLRLVRDATGAILSAEAHVADIPPSTRDTEGLALGPTGLFAAFEGPALVAKVGGNPLPRHPDFRKMRSNGALEALAMDAAGQLYTLAERSRGDTLPLYRFAQGTWAVVHHLPKRDGFLPVGADFGPDGLFYLLERQFTVVGFRSRVRRFDLDATDLSEATLLTTYALHHDNLEGLSVWRDASGLIRLTMVSDDNFQPLQRSQVVEYTVNE